MKKILLALVVTFSAQAFSETSAPVFPQIYNLGNRVQVQVWNNTPAVITCSGSIWMNTVSGNNYSEYYFETIFSGMNSFRSVYPRNPQDQIRYVTHSIFCR